MANYLRRHSGLIVKRFFSQNSQLPFRNSRLVTKIPPIRKFHNSFRLDKIVSFNLSDIGEGIREVVVKEWYVKEGDIVQQFDNLCEVQSDKASVTITSRYDGKIVKIHHKVDGIAFVGQPLLDFDVPKEDGEEKESGSSSSSSSSSSSDDEGKSGDSAGSEPGKHKVLTTPAVRRLAMENNLDLTKVTPTGKYGRLLKGDVLEHLNLIPRGTVKPHPTLLTQQVKADSDAAPKIKPPSSISATDYVEQLKGVRKVMYASMTKALKIPHFAYCDEIDLTNLVQLRNELKVEATAFGVKLTFMPFFIKAASMALHKYPILNSSVDESTESVIFKSNHNISVAMDTPQGLVVPNVKNCQNKSVVEIAQALNDLQERGQRGILRPDDFADGTFSLSNIGVIGGTYTHPCIMTPQVAIGAVGITKILPRFGPNDEIIKAHIMSVSWCGDHRVIDGVTMANFSNLWKKYLENPYLFILT